MAERRIWFSWNYFAAAAAANYSSSLGSRREAFFAERIDVVRRGYVMYAHND